MAKRKPKRPAKHKLNFDPRALFAYGPVIRGLVSMPDSMAAAYRLQNKPVPDPVPCRFLVDTGATRSFIVTRIAELSKVPCIDDAIDFHGVGSITGKRVFGRIDLLFQASVRGTAVDRKFTIHTEINSANLPHAQHIDGLLGRDVLCHFELTYNGKTGEVSFTFLG